MMRLLGLPDVINRCQGMMMVMIRLNIPSVFMYGGTILPGKFKGKDVDVVNVFEAVGQHATGQMSDADLKELECVCMSICWCMWWSIYG